MRRDAKPYWIIGQDAEPELRAIYEHCILMPCDSDLCFDEVECRILTAETNVRCIECKELITPGHKFELLRGYTVWWDQYGDEKRKWKWFHTCIPCSRILTDPYLFPEGRIYGGALWEYLKDYGLTPDGVIGDD